jgi:hypothetical protein
VDNRNDNPVFAYRAGFRRAAAIIQRWSMLIGFACLLVGSATWLVAVEGSRTQRAGGWQCLIGLVLIVAGILWGLWWRGHLREAFRKEFGER